MSLDARAWIFFAGLAAAEVTIPAAAAACPSHLQFLDLQCDHWRSLVLPETLPPARGNARADDEAAAALGMKVFYDNRFSKSGSGIACANCHDPEHAFSERKRTSHTIKEVARNAPDLFNAAWYTRSHFWDGKVDNLWSAPLFTFEQEDEMGSTRLSVVHTLSAIYKIRYEKIFGAMPDLSDRKRFPASGKPGTPEFDAMSAQDKDTVNEVYVNLGKTLEAYVRKVAAGRAPFDDFIAGSTKSISVDAQRGMAAFSRYKCASCHAGSTFTDERFHNLGVPASPGQPEDSGRASGLRFSSNWQFSSTSRFADPSANLPMKAAVLPDEPDGFRTPSLRNLALSSPYGHNGAFDTLDQAIDAHARVLPGGVAPDANDKRDIIAFLRSLNGRPPFPPWNYWPGG